MTENTSYSGSTYPSATSDDPNEIRADIDQTRAAVGEKIDQLQARLDPSRLKQQATETVNEILTDTATSVKEYVTTHRDELLSSVADAARRNPLPTALMGIGLGWLILESMAGSKRHDDDSQYERRNLSPGPRRGYYGGGYEGSTGRSRGPAIDDEYYNEEFGGYGSSAGYAMGPEYQGERDYGREYGNGKQHQKNPVAKATGAVKDTVSDVTQNVTERASDMGQDIKERAEDAGQEIKERMGDVKERVGDMGERVSDAVSGAFGGMRHQAGEMRDQAEHGMQKAGYRMEEWQQRARYEGQRRGKQAVRHLEDNPLVYGAVALAAGAALGLLLPSTRTESRVFGEMRDQVMDKGKEVLDTAKSRAQEVIEEVRPELEEKTRQIVSDATAMGKEIVKDAAEEIRPVVDKAVAKTKEEAKNVAQEAGIDPNKLTGGSSQSGTSQSGASQSGSSPSGKSSSGSSMGSTSTATATGDKSSNDPLVVNRDILKGQWTKLKGEVKSKWGQLTDDDLTKIEGDMDKLTGTLQTRYGYERARAEQEVNNFFKNRSA
jgi:uncharacterized protein YjbJ (UPF0337 family)